MALATTQNVVSVKACTNHPVFKLRCLFRASPSTFRLICASSWWVERRRSSSSPQTTLPLTLRSMCMTTGPWVSAGCLVLCPQLAWSVLRKYWRHNTDSWWSHSPRFCLSHHKAVKEQGIEAMFALVPAECSVHIHLHVNQLHTKTQKERDSSPWQQAPWASMCAYWKRSLKQTWNKADLQFMLHAFCEQGPERAKSLHSAFSSTTVNTLGSVCGSSSLSSDALPSVSP